MPKNSRFLSKIVDSTIKKYLDSLIHVIPKNITLTLILMVFISLTEGIGLILLVPLLQLVGLDVQYGALNQIENFLFQLFAYFGIKPTLISVLTLFVVIMGLNAFIYRLQSIQIANIEYEYGSYLRNQLYSAITNSKWLFFSKNRSSDFAHALTNEIDRIGMGTYELLYLITNIAVIFIYFLFALKISLEITVITFLVGIFIIVLLKRKTNLAQIRGEEISKEVKKFYSTVLEHLDGMKTIKSFRMESQNVNEFEKLNDRLKLSYIDTVKNYADVTFLFSILSVIILSILVIIIIDVLLIPTASLLLLIFLFIRMIPKFSTIQQNYQYFINMLPSFSNVMKIKESCEIESELYYLKQEKITMNNEIWLDNVSFNYNEDMGVHAVQDINLVIPAGKTTAIIGPSGAGKSTVADIIMGLINPTDGNVMVDDNALNSKNILNWRDQIGYVAQDPFLFHDTILNNLIVANPDANRSDIENALQMAAARKFISKLPDELETVVGDRGVRLSGGEKQRLTLARALLSKPTLLILDEATSNLDSENEKIIQDSILKLHGKMTILVIAHRFSSIKNADIIYLIENGKLVESGTLNELINKEKGRFRELYKSQI
ncbi:MAG: ABC transporter ATP-binding protein [Methanobacterium sp.]|uniref:ABC transporter ATP-binding protein n=1 Tax=Methanobacterium sp. TaxID=2164 RepID=UPI003D65EB3C|nr:ABC transporter ATP-binding protein [Methanobacterium sp.]